MRSIISSSYIPFIRIGDFAEQLSCSGLGIIYVLAGNGLDKFAGNKVFHLNHSSHFIFHK